jgi:hypothetical protein
MRVGEDRAKWRAIGEAMSSSGLWWADDDDAKHKTYFSLCLTTEKSDTVILN